LEEEFVSGDVTGIFVIFKVSVRGKAKVLKKK
jgi:hypothetical protein